MKGWQVTWDCVGDERIHSSHRSERGARHMAQQMNRISALGATATDPIFGDPVFVCAYIIHSLDPAALSDASIDHHLGGPTAALLTFGEHRYRLTIERETT